jgi:hypothetical protein
VREETIVLPRGVYKDIGYIAATLNQGVGLRGERNGFIYNFITRGGKLAIEASHKQPEPSFMEIVPCNFGLGLMEQDVLHLRTNEKLVFPFDVVSVIV